MSPVTEPQVIRVVRQGPQGAAGRNFSMDTDTVAGGASYALDADTHTSAHLLFGGSTGSISVTGGAAGDEVSFLLQASPNEFPLSASCLVAFGAGITMFDGSANKEIPAPNTALLRLIYTGSEWLGYIAAENP